MATIFFSAWNSLWFASGVVVVGLLLLIWSYRAVPAGPLRLVCPFLKLLGLAALCACLLEPMWSGQHARPGANLFAVVADNSQSLQLKDRGATRKRADVLSGLLNPQRASWQETLEENFEVRRYYFDARLQACREFSELSFDGRGSAIGSALRTLAERYQGRPLAGVLLLTDGNATDIHDAANLNGLPPVYPVIIGSADAARDISIRDTRTTQTDFEDAPVSIQADVAATGYAGESIVAQVIDTHGKAVAEQALKAGKGEDLLAFRFQLRPEKPGLSFYRVRVRAKSEVGLPDKPETTSEATLANNSTVLAVDRGHGPYRILYVSGRPNWEFKFLNRAVQEDVQLQLAGLIRIAKREPKFNFLGHTDESSNPLFRGFNNQSAEEVESYDQPVLVRLNTRDEMELRGGFPRTPEELYGYHAVIVGDLESEFFTPDQEALLQKFVSERGGGFLMLGGMESFQQGHYQRTPIGDMLPVYLDRAEDGNGPPGPLRMDLTREGWLQSWARVRDNEGDEEARIRGMAPFQVLNHVREVKPGATVIATVADNQAKTWPALVVQRFGRGRTAALTLGDFWHWGFHDADAHHDMDKAWRQLMRWLVNDAPNRVELTAEPVPDDPNGAVRLEARVRDPRFQAMDNATLDLRVRPVMAEGAGVETNAIRLPVEPSLEEPGLYQATYVPRLTGGYDASLCVTNADGQEVGRAEAGWSTDLAAEEFRSLAPNVALMEAIARRTGGEVIRADKLDQFARDLPHRHAPVMEPWTHPLWHTPAMFGFALMCLVGEWGLRRWKGMP